MYYNNFSPLLFRQWVAQTVEAESQEAETVEAESQEAETVEAESDNLLTPIGTAHGNVST